MTQQQEQLILNFLQNYRPMMTKICVTSGLDLEEVMQEVALVLTQKVPHMKPTDNIKALTYTVAYRHILRMLRQRTWKPMEAVSLDNPVDNESQTTYADLLPAQEQHESYPQWHIRELYSALHRLPLDEQQELKQQYDLEGFHPWGPIEKQGRLKERSHRSLVTTAFRTLRNDEFLREAVVA